MRVELLPAESSSAPAAEGGAASPPAAHLLPCEIEYSGDALVSAYFKPVTGKRGHLEATFRGRALCGKTLEPPAGYVGALLQDTKHASVADGETRRWLHRGAIDAFTVWKHDELPEEDEPAFKCMRWAGIASVLHADVGDEEATEEA